MSEQTFIEKVAGLSRVTERLLEGKENYKQAAENTVKQLVGLGAVKAEDCEKVASALISNPEKALSMLTKVAEANKGLVQKLHKQASEIKEAAEKASKQKELPNLGTPDTSEKRSNTTQGNKSESDKVWERMFAV